MIPGFQNQQVLTPIDLLYGQIQLVLRERSQQQGANEALQGLLSMIDPIKDDPFKTELDEISKMKDATVEKMLWRTMTAIFMLLDRKKLWTFKLVVRAGEEFIQGT